MLGVYFKRRVEIRPRRQKGRHRGDKRHRPLVIDNRTLVENRQGRNESEKVTRRSEKTRRPVRSLRFETNELLRMLIICFDTRGRRRRRRRLRNEKMKKTYHSLRDVLYTGSSR